MSGVALLFVFPARSLPDYRPGAIPDDPPPPSPDELRRGVAEQ
jgi:hypothetical protein